MGSQSRGIGSSGQPTNKIRQQTSYQVPSPASQTVLSPMIVHVRFIAYPKLTTVFQPCRPTIALIHFGAKGDVHPFETG
jgi:hypothetical protein